jgi:hypothetical protein
MATDSATATPFVICIRNDGFDASLEVRKLYRTLPDADAAGHSLVRLIDESGEDYLYPADRFLQVDLPEAVETILLRAS